MKFELKKIKFFDAMSQETPCFTAEIWENGNKIADVKNDGHGGGNQVNNIHGVNTYKDVAKFDNLNTECKIFDMVYDFAETKKLQTKSFVLKKEDKMFTVKFPKPISKLKKASNFQDWKDVEISKFEMQGYKVLNTNL